MVRTGRGRIRGHGCRSTIGSNTNQTSSFVRIQVTSLPADYNFVGCPKCLYFLGVEGRFEVERLRYISRRAGSRQWLHTAHHGMMHHIIWKRKRSRCIWVTRSEIIPGTPGWHRSALKSENDFFTPREIFDSHLSEDFWLYQALSFLIRVHCYPRYMQFLSTFGRTSAVKTTWLNRVNVPQTHRCVPDVESL